MTDIDFARAAKRFDDVVLVTNRLGALDPALIRRARVIRFDRPGAEARRVLFERILEGVEHTAKDIDVLLGASNKEPPFSFSDIVEHEQAQGRLRDIDRLATDALKLGARRKLKTVDRDLVVRVLGEGDLLGDD